MKVLGIIPARAGSKGVPGKNRRELGGMSLVERTYRVAIESGVLDRIVVSTDDFQVLAIAQKIGLEVPFIRPAELSGDGASMIDVVGHTLAELDKTGYRPGAVMLLQPTSPLRTADHIRHAFALIGGGDSVCSVVPLPQTMCPHYVMRVDEAGHLVNFLAEGAQITRRQDVPQAFVRDGTIYLTRYSVLIQRRTFYGNECIPMVLDPAESLSIDTEEDWNLASRRLTAKAA